MLSQTNRRSTRRTVSANRTLSHIHAVALLFVATAVLVAHANAEETGEGTYNNVTLDNHDGESEHHEEEIEPVHAVLLPWFVQACGIVIFYGMTRFLHLVPYTCALFLVGILLGAGAARTGLQDQLTESITLWRAINSEVLFTVFLPGLLFKGMYMYTIRYE